MKLVLQFFFVFIVFSQTIFSQTIPADSLYLGQKLSDSNPELFLLPVSPGFFAAERITFSNDGKTIYYSELNGYFDKARVKYYNYSHNKWNGPYILFEGYFSPMLTPGNDTIFLQKAADKATQIWFSIKSGTSWCDPIRFMPDKKLQYLLQVTNNGNFYFSSEYSNGGLGKRDWSKLVITGKDTTLQSLGPPLCTSDDDVDFCVSRNDSVIIIAAKRTETTNKLDLFISYRKNNNFWTTPQNLGPKININNPNDGRWSPSLTSDNKYLFYTGGWNSPKIYWVRINNLIDSIKQTNLTPKD